MGDGAGGGGGVGSRYLVFQDSKLRSIHDKPVVSLYATIFLTLSEAFFYLFVEKTVPLVTYIHLCW